MQVILPGSITIEEKEMKTQKQLREKAALILAETTRRGLPVQCVKINARYKRALIAYTPTTQLLQLRPDVVTEDIEKLMARIDQITKGVK